MKKKPPTARKQLDGFIAKFTPQVAGVARKALVKMRARLPGAVELVYDNYNALAIAFSPTDRLGDVVCSIALYPRWVSLFLMNGPSLPDPRKLLQGSGSRVRHIVLEDATTLDDPAVVAILEHAVGRAKKPFGPRTAARLIVKSVSAKQRPRRPGKDLRKGGLGRGRA